MHSVNQWKQSLADEGVLNSQSIKEIFQHAGYSKYDESTSQWINERAMIGSVRKGFSGNDYGCKYGKIFGAGFTSYAPGYVVIYALPKKYAKSNVSAQKTKVISKAIDERVAVIGLGKCANPYQAWAYVVFYVRNTPKPKPKPQPKPMVPPAPTPQTPTPTPVPPSPPTIINHCGNVIIGGNSNEQGGNCNTCVGIDVCNEETKAPPTCPYGTVGTPPNCKEKPEPFNLQIQQEVYVNETSYICASVRAPKGDKLHVHFHAKYGYFAEEGFQDSAYGGETGYCAKYQAPSEVIPGGDTYWVLVEDETTGLDSAPEKEAVTASINVIERSTFY
jgi:hypothetical protein